MRTVARRSCSAISPNPGIALLGTLAMSGGSMRTLADNNAGFLERAAADKFHRKRFADGFRAELLVNVFEPRDRFFSERDKNVANDDARFLCRTFRFNLEHDGRGFVAPLQRFAQRIGQTHRLQADAEVAAWDAPFFQERIDYAVYCGRGHGNRSKAREPRSGDADGLPVCDDDRATDGGWLQADIEANVWSKGRADPGAPLGGHQADDAERGHRAAGARASNNQSKAAWLD